MFRTSNPAFRQDAFAPAQTWESFDGPSRADSSASAESAAVAAARAQARPQTMTINGVVHRTWFLLALCVITAMFAWNIVLAPDPILSPGFLLFGGMISGLITGLICIFNPRSAPFTAPLYAVSQGAFVGAISAFYALGAASKAHGAGGLHQFGTNSDTGPLSLNTGLILNAALLTFGILAGLLAGYSTGLIRPGPWFRKALITAMIGILFYGLIAFIASLFGAHSLASVYDPSNGGLVSVGFSLLLVAIASANFVLDFEFVEQGVRNKAPRYLEWYAGFGILVTMIWLYLELLRLLSKLQRRD